jgi:hypothetical protein
MDRPSRGSWLGFVLATTLNLYNHSLALLPLSAEVLALAGWASLRAWSDRRGRGGRPAGAELRVRPRLTAVATGALVSALLSLPVISKVFLSLGNKGLTPSQTAPFKLTWRFLRTAFGSYGAGRGAALFVFAALAAVGLAAVSLCATCSSSSLSIFCSWASAVSRSFAGRLASGTPSGPGGGREAKPGAGPPSRSF